VYGTNAGSNAGRLAILAGGVTIQDSQQSLTLPVGVWHVATSPRRIARPDLDPFLPGQRRPGSRIFIRDRASQRSEFRSTFFGHRRSGFNGLIDDVRFTSLDTPNALLEFWRFHEGTGSIATGVHGGVLNLNNTSWVRVSRDNDDN
jgi:hypothetical protein